MPSTSLHGIQIKRLQDHNYGRQDLKRSPEQSVGDIHRSENVEQAQQCWSSCHRKWSSAMLRSPFWLKQFGSIVCCPYLFQFDCQYCTEGNKPYDCTSFMFRCKHSKWRKANKKGSDIFKETMTNYDMPSCHVCAISSFEGFAWNQHVFSSVIYVLCAQQPSFAIFIEG